RLTGRRSPPTREAIRVRPLQETSRDLRRETAAALRRDQVRRPVLIRTPMIRMTLRIDRGDRSRSFRGPPTRRLRTARAPDRCFDAPATISRALPLRARAEDRPDP